MPDSEEKTVTLTPIQEQQPVEPAKPIEPTAEERRWMINIGIQDRGVSLLHVAGLLNLVVSLDIIGASSLKDPSVAKNPRAKEIYSDNIREAQTLAMIHITQLINQHNILPDEIIEAMTKDYMESVPKNMRGQVKEEDVREQALGVLQTGFAIVDRCRAENIRRYSGAKPSSP